MPALWLDQASSISAWSAALDNVVGLGDVERTVTEGLEDGAGAEDGVGHTPRFRLDGDTDVAADVTANLLHCLREVRTRDDDHAVAAKTAQGAQVPFEQALGAELNEEFVT